MDQHLAIVGRHRRRELPLPLVERVRADPETLRNLSYRIASLGDLRHRVPLEPKVREANSSLKLALPITASLPQN